MKHDRLDTEMRVINYTAITATKQSQTWTVSISCERDTHPEVF